MEQLTVRLTQRQIDALERIFRVLSAAYSESCGLSCAEASCEPYTGADLDELEGIVVHLRQHHPRAPSPAP